LLPPLIPGSTERASVPTGEPPGCGPRFQPKSGPGNRTPGPSMRPFPRRRSRGLRQPTGRITSSRLPVRETVSRARGVQTRGSFLLCGGGAKLVPQSFLTSRTIGSRLRHKVPLNLLPRLTSHHRPLGANAHVSSIGAPWPPPQAPVSDTPSCLDSVAYDLSSVQSHRLWCLMLVARSPVGKLDPTPIFDSRRKERKCRIRSPAWRSLLSRGEPTSSIPTGAFQGIRTSPR